MIVRDVLADKGTDVATIAPGATVAEMVERLAERGIGALVVSADGSSIDGIVSERDLARGLHAHGADVLSLPVERLMTADVRTCSPGDRIQDIAKLMTQGRFRHLPVLEDGALVGIVSIGDVVKKRINELETETDQLVDYVSGTR